jgi:hypothetical protein
MDQLNFSDIFSESFTQLSTDSNLSLIVIVFNIFYAGLIGTFIALIYRKYFMGVLFQKSFAVAIITVTMITTLIIMVISGNLILSLGMVGALSIVRFRAAIKDPLDVVYIFWAVGSGIAIGVSQYSLVFFALIAIGLVLALLSRVSTTQEPKLLVISSAISSQKKIQDQVRGLGRNITTRSTQMVEGRSEMVFETTDNIDFATLSGKLIELDETVELRILNYYGNS